MPRRDRRTTTEPDPRFATPLREMGSMEDEEQAGALIEAVKRDRRYAFPDLVAAYEHRIHRFASRMCRNAEDARDVLQDTFLAAFRAIGDFRGEAKFSTWLFRIAGNACRKMRRRGKFEPERELSLDEFMPGPAALAASATADPAPDPEVAVMTAELRQALEAGIAELPRPYRIVLVLRDVEGFSAEEVAEILELSVPAVKSRLHRARLSLRQQLAEHRPGPAGAA
jgi:RNA polymerase sigma-70 factor (ECF subfamily)